jgi:2'-5' RNA ligase
MELAAAIRQHLAARRIGFDAKPFVPHVTVLRDLAAPLEPRPVAPIRWPVERVELLASRFDRPSYQTLAAWDLVPR